MHGSLQLDRMLRREDEDYNDVAAMGGVNLSEESKNILASNSGLLSGQMRSCKDEAVFSTQSLVTKINRIGKIHCDPQYVLLLSCLCCLKFSFLVNIVCSKKARSR